MAPVTTQHAIIINGPPPSVSPYSFPLLPLRLSKRVQLRVFIRYLISFPVIGMTGPVVPCKDTILAYDDLQTVGSWPRRERESWRP